MKQCTLILLLVLGIVLPLAAGGRREVVRTASSETEQSIRVTIEEGEEYHHKLKVLPLIRVKSPPQLAIWTETPGGEFIETLYVTGRSGEQSWRSAPLDSTPAEMIRRPEALPVWRHRSSGEEIDGRTAATPKGGYDVIAASPEPGSRVRLFLEVNHSTDFNDRYPEDAEEDSPFYSGGAWGSGQPSLVYSGVLDSERATVPLELLGHGSPDGSDGEIRRTLDGVTTAQSILKEVNATIQS